MRFPCLSLAAATVFAAAGAGASVAVDVPSSDLLRTCLAELRALADKEGHAESHRYDLGERCPELARRLAVSPLVADGAGAIDAVSIEGLRDIQSLATGFRRPPEPDRFTPDYEGLDALTAEVLVTDEADDDIWQRFRRWLETRLREGTSPGLERFADWLEDLDPPPWLGDVLLKGSVVLIVLLALMVIGNEIRLSGILRRPRRRVSANAVSVPPGPRPARSVASLDELSGMAPRQMAAAVMTIVTVAFAERGWLSASSSLTNGELSRQVSRHKNDLLAVFTGLVTGVEKILYGDRLPDDESRRRLLDAAKTLVEAAHAGSPPPMGKRR